MTDDDLAAVAKLRCHALIAVGAAGGLVDVGDLAGQLSATRTFTVLPPRNPSADGAGSAAMEAPR